MIAGGFGKFWTRKAMQSIRLHCWGGALRRTYRAVVSTPLSRQGNDGVLELAMNFIKRTANLHERHAVRLFGLHWNTTKKLTFTYFWTREKFSSLAKEHFETNVNCSSRAAAHLLHPGLSSSSLWWHRFFPSSVTFCSVGSRCCNSHTANVVVVRLRGRPIRYGASAACSRYAISRDIPYRPATTVNSFFLQSECIIYAQVVLTLPSLQVYFMLCMVCWLLQDHVGFGDLTYINTYKWVVDKYSNKYL